MPLRKPSWVVMCHRGSRLGSYMPLRKPSWVVMCQHVAAGWVVKPTKAGGHGGGVHDQLGLAQRRGRHAPGAYTRSLYSST